MQSQITYVNDSLSRSGPQQDADRPKVLGVPDRGPIERGNG
jgi:hypothetical protein